MLEKGTYIPHMAKSLVVGYPKVDGSVVLLVKHL